jgi:hypothetical protein
MTRPRQWSAVGVIGRVRRRGGYGRTPPPVLSIMGTVAHGVNAPFGIHVCRPEQSAVREDQRGAQHPGAAVYDCWGPQMCAIKSEGADEMTKRLRSCGGANGAIG